MRVDAGCQRAAYKPHRDRLGDKLGQQEIAVLELLCAGNPSKVVAHILQISQRTVDNHRSSIMAKTRCRSLVELGVWAAKQGLV